MKEGRKTNSFYDRWDFFAEPVTGLNMEGAKQIGTSIGFLFSIIMTVLVLAFSIGKIKIFFGHLIKKHLKNYLFSGILLNSLMSILSFNHFDFALMFGKVLEGDKQGRMHKSKFWRQIVYNIIIVVTNLG